MTNFWYNLSNVDGENGMLGLFQSINSIFFFHLFGFFILVVLFIIIFRATLTYNNTPKVSVLYTSFFMAIISILFKLLGLANDNVVYVFIVIFLISIALQFLMD